MSTEAKKEYLLYHRCKRRWWKDGENRPTSFPPREPVNPNNAQLYFYWRVKNDRRYLRDITKGDQSDRRDLGRRLA